LLFGPRLGEIITLALFAAVLATSFASALLAQSFAFRAASRPRSLRIMQANQAFGTTRQFPTGGHIAVRRRGVKLVKLYDEVPDVQTERYWPSAAALGSSR
jgi:hypothetical protein